MPTLSPFEAVKAMHAPALSHVCRMCDRPYEPKGKHRKNSVICGAWECRSALSKAQAAHAAEARRAKAWANLKPIEGPVKTILQPQLAAFWHGAANTSMSEAA